jgi:hypothetical protein
MQIMQRSADAECCKPRVCGAPCRHHEVLHIRGLRAAVLHEIPDWPDVRARRDNGATVLSGEIVKREQCVADDGLVWARMLSRKVEAAGGAVVPVDYLCSRAPRIQQRV